MEEETIVREPGWFRYFEEETPNNCQIKRRKGRPSDGISIIVETPEYLKKKEQERLEEERRKEQERLEIERQKELERLEKERLKREEEERRARELLEAQREEERRQLEKQKKIEDMQNRIDETMLDDDYWKEIPFCKSVRISKTGKIMQIILTKEKKIAELIPIPVCFNRMRKQLEVDFGNSENEGKVYSIQELMAITWMDYTPNNNTRVVLKDENPLHLSLDNIGFENVEE